MRDTQGMAIGVSTQAVMDGRDAILAVAMNGVPLPPARLPGPGRRPGPVRLRLGVPVGRRHGTDHLRRLQRLWVKRGLVGAGGGGKPSPASTPLSPARPSPRAPSSWQASLGPAQGVARVEVGVDGVWREATWPAGTIDTWRQWCYRWDATPGAHNFQVRATDQTRLRADRGGAGRGAERGHRLPPSR